MTISELWRGLLVHELKLMSWSDLIKQKVSDMWQIGLELIHFFSKYQKTPNIKYQRISGKNCTNFGIA